MADIRYATAVWDDLLRPDELYPPGILPPWYHSPGWDLPVELDGSSIKSPSFDPNYQAMSQYRGFRMSGPKIEVWAQAHQNADLHDGFYMGLLREDGSGYYARWANNVGDDPVSIRRLDGGSGTVLVSTGNWLIGLGQMAMMQIAGDTISVYYSTDSGANWNLLASASDGTYREDLYGSLGMQGGAPRWLSIGGGPIRKDSEFYRRLNN